ncbi:MAG: MATE family efflux transporter, partial [Acetivibrio sp.]
MVLKVKTPYEKKITTSNLLKFTLPSIIMMVFMSLYTITDGIFVSRFLGSNALSSINIVFPIISFITAFGVMIATGGSAIIAKKMGEGKREHARSSFTFFVVVGIIFSIITLVFTLVFLSPIVRFLGANDSLMENCRAYLGTLVLFAPACVLQLLFQSFFVTDGNPHIGLVLTIIGGVTNAVFDYIFLGPMGFGIEGAAIATGLGQMIPAVFGIFYFFLSKKELFFVRFSFDGPTLLKACLNGSSEMVSNLSN